MLLVTEWSEWRGIERVCLRLLSTQPQDRCVFTQISYESVCIIVHRIPLISQPFYFKDGVIVLRHSTSHLYMQSRVRSSGTLFIGAQVHSL